MNNKWLNANTFFLDYDIIHNLDFLILKYLENNDISGINLKILEGIDDSVIIRFLEDRNKINIFNWLSTSIDIDSDNNMYNTWKSRFPINDTILDKSITDFIKGFINFCYSKNSVKKIYVRSNSTNINRKKCLKKIFGDKYHLISIIKDNELLTSLEDSDVIITSSEDMIKDNFEIVKTKLILVPNQSFRFKQEKINNMDVVKSINGWEFRKDIFVSFINLYNITEDMFNYG